MNFVVGRSRVLGSFISDKNALAGFRYIGPGDLGIPFTGFWSLRAFKNATIGTPAINLRRTNDNAQSDFSTLQSAFINEAGISGFAGGNPTRITQWYDQASNFYHALQATSAKQGLYTPNVLNGHGVFDNSAGTAGIGPYEPATDPVNFQAGPLGSLSCYAVFNSTDAAFNYSDFMGSDSNEWEGLACGNIFPHNHFQVEAKNESSVGGGVLQQGTGITLNTWYAWASTVYFQPAGANSFYNFNNVFSAFADVNGGVTGLGTTTNHFCFLGDETPNIWFGYAVEGGFYFNPGPGLNGWTLGQTQALIANARSFWSI